MRSLFHTALFTASLALALPAAAQQTAHLRGEVTGLEANVATVETTSGESYDVTMTDDYNVLVYEFIDIADVRPGDFLSIPSVTSDNGDKVAMSINVFPESLRGTGEGERAWDLTEDSLMTNATVGEVVNAADGSVIVVSYDDKDEPVLVPDDTPITEFAIDPERKLEVGDQVILFVEQGEGGQITANLAGVTVDGSLPPV